MKSIRELADERIIVGDGATGTVLHRRLPRGSSIDLVALEHPEALQKLHVEYIQAGSMVIQTHTFGTSRLKLAKLGCEEIFEKVNSRAVKIARDAREMVGKDVLVAGSIGSIFRSLDEGGLTPDSFAEQAAIFDERGCDLIMLETFTTLGELKSAVIAVRKVTSLPIIAQLTVPDEWSPTPSGSRQQMLDQLLEIPADFVGLNCGTGPDEYLEILEEWDGISDHYVSMQPNAGVPVRKDGRLLYPQATPEYFAYFAQEAARYGVRFIGGCCGTDPSHIKAVADAVREIKPKAASGMVHAIPPEMAEEKIPEATSSFLAKIQSGEFVTVVQLDPPKGTNVGDLIELARTIKDHHEVSAVDLNANPLGRLHFDSLWLASQIEREVGIETIPHVTPRDASLMGLESQLLGAWNAGIRNLLVITGDPSQLGDYPGAWDVYQADSIGLVKTIRRLNQGVDWFGNPIGNPPSFVIGVAVNPGAEDRIREIEKLKNKIESGAQFAMSQVFFSWDVWESFWEDFGSRSPIPVLVGIWPLTSYRLAMRIANEIPGVNIPDDLLAKLESSGPGARELGWELAKKMYDESRKYASGAYLIAPYKRGETILQLID
jgi:methionine synthase / methylenetetrahydrofolate reductase(NADPH)